MNIIITLLSAWLFSIGISYKIEKILNKQKETLLEVKRTNEVEIKKVPIFHFIPIINLAMTINNYMKYQKYEKSLIENEQNDNKDSKFFGEGENEKKPRFSKRQEPMTILFCYHDIKRQGEILYEIHQGFPFIINSTGEFTKMSSLEQAAMVRNEYQQFKNELDADMASYIDTLFEPVEPTYNVEDLLDRDNVLVCDIKSLKENGTMLLTPFEQDGKKSKINSSLVKVKQNNKHV